MLGQFNEALEMADRASQLARRIANEWGRANASIFIGLLHLACGNIDQAFELLEEISPMAHAIGHPGAILCEVQMGWIYLSLGAQEQATAHLQLADQWSQSFPPFLIASQAGLARSALTRGDLATAKQLIDESRKHGLFETLLLFDQMFELTVLEYHVTCREWTQARQQADALLAQMDDYRVRYGLPVALQLKAEIELAEGKPDLALTCLQKAVELASTLNAHTWLWPALARLAAVHEQLGQQSEADTSRARAIQSLQHIAASTVRAELHQSLAAHATGYGLSFSPPTPI
jgi:tetratricopeptide (TPR) repeat protein